MAKRITTNGNENTEVAKDKKEKGKDKTFRFTKEQFARVFRFKADLEYAKGDSVKYGEMVMILLDEYEKHNPKE